MSIRIDIHGCYDPASDVPEHRMYHYITTISIDGAHQQQYSQDMLDALHWLSGVILQLSIVAYKQKNAYPKVGGIES